MGARLLRAWLGRPLLDPALIGERQDAIQRLVADGPLRARLIALLSSLPDLERLGVRSAQQILAPRECLALASGLELIPRLRQELQLSPPLGMEPEARDLLAGLVMALDAIQEASSDIRATVREGATLFEEGVIREGVSEELDQQRALRGDARTWIAGLEQKERERTGLRALKVGYNKVFGYYLEVTAGLLAQSPDQFQQDATGAKSMVEHLERLGWTRKQTVAGGERFITPELKDLEGKVARAQEEAIRLERSLYNELLGRLSVFAERVSGTARSVAQIDVLVALAEAAVANRYVRPLVDESDEIQIAGGRHAVVEQALPQGSFVPNDLLLNADSHLMLLTGPNMAGKSTYLRQAALLVLMAQIGSFIPADQARIGIVDRILTRIGAHDDIASGRSTFMVEMTEAATILRSATARSLVVLDEVGRGTSTYDGMAIAQAIVEDLHDPDRPGGAPKTIFATHYHELTVLAETLPGLRNFRVDVLERGDSVVFLHSVVEGAADRSYGVHVARLAGIPTHVTARAQSLLSGLEARPKPELNRVLSHPEPESGPCAVCTQLRAIDVLRLTPLQAQAELARLIELVESRQ
jgi:DNA mismatch repair protein MutS